MKKIFFFIFFFLSIYIYAQQNFIPSIEQLIKESAQADAFSGNLIIGKDGKIIYKNSTGFADWEKMTPLNDSTLFNIGSIGKDFTQVVMIQLEGEKKIRFEDPISKFLDIFPDSIGKKITLRMLLTMESGLGDYHDRPFRNLAERLDYIKTLPLLFEPGTSREYSNSGYVVLAAVIEKVTGKSFEKNVTERIFSPLQMNHSSFIYPRMNIPNRASGTDIKPDGKKITEHEINDDLTPSGDGAEYSTAPDLLKFYSSLVNDNKLLDNTQKQDFFSRFNKDRAFSMDELKSNPNAISGFAGGLNGWNSCVDVYFGLATIVVTLSNFSDSDQPAEELNRRISQILRGEKYDAPRMPRFVFAYKQYKKLGAVNFTQQINNLLGENGYTEIQGPYFFNRIGEQLYDSNLFEDAVIVYKYNTELFPRAPRSWLFLGMSLNKIGKKEEAKTALKKCMQIDPENKEAKRLLSEM